MKLIDSCGWLEYLTDGPLSARYEKELTVNLEEILVIAEPLYGGLGERQIGSALGSLDQAIA